MSPSRARSACSFLSEKKGLSPVESLLSYCFLWEQHFWVPCVPGTVTWLCASLLVGSTLFAGRLLVAAEEEAGCGSAPLEMLSLQLGPDVLCVSCGAALQPCRVLRPPELLPIRKNGKQQEEQRRQER